MFRRFRVQSLGLITVHVHVLSYMSVFFRLDEFAYLTHAHTHTHSHTHTCIHTHTHSHMHTHTRIRILIHTHTLTHPHMQDIVILRFEWVEEDRDSYTSLLNYLVRKHRCAVIGSRNFFGIKDFYLVPLLENVDPAPQLLPFRGPGRTLLLKVVFIFLIIIIQEM